MKREIKDLYQALGLTRNASADDIRKAYRTYAAKFHPDKHDGDPFFEERFKEIKEAYETLVDDELRWKYDMRKFRRSIVVRKANPEEFVPDNDTNHRVRLKLEVSHIDAYLAAVFFINLVAWVIIQELTSKVSAVGLISSVFLCMLSSLLFWLFIHGLVEKIKKKSSPKNYFLLSYLLTSLVIGFVLLWTSWIS